MTPLPGTAAETRPVPFARDLARHGDRTALITPGGELSYRDLAERVGAEAGRLGPWRRLVLLAGANEVDAVVVYLAALSAGHPVLLAPGDRPDGLAALVAAYDPDVVVTPAGQWRLDERRAGSTHRPHPDLALLLTTSGSTSSAKLVRLSQDNLQANAESIATYLGIRPDDRAATTLPMHYCYGLSVINSHLLRGAALILTGASVTDPGFWELFRQRGGTSFAGVPYTFDLLDRVGFDRMDLPRLRYVTQAGGRLAPERVRRYAQLGQRRGWDLFVMYGQTEATARMAYLPPDLAATHPGCVGVPIPGGSFRLAPLPDWPDPDTGELIYKGPNVMLGYAERPADLAAGRVVGELATGDIARRTPEGLYEVVGRRSRFVKVFGLRIDLQRVEAMLAEQGRPGCCAGQDGELVLVLETGTGRDGATEPLRLRVAAACGLPAAAVRVRTVPELPRLPSGKPDYPAIQELARASAGGEPDPADLCALYAQVLGRTGVGPDDTFVSLGGDSLSFVELSVRLERALGRLPRDWHATPIRNLRRGGRVRSRVARVDTSVALRAIAIVLVVGTHTGLFAVSGGAHLLLGVAGFNFARFHLAAGERWRRLRRAGRGIARVAVPSAVWIALVLPFTDMYGIANVFLLNFVLGSEDTPKGWHFWFLESLVYIQLAVVLLLAVPVVDRWQRRFPFGLPMALAGLGLLTRYELVPVMDHPVVPRGTPVVVFWLFALGWAAAKATGRWRRVLVTLAVAATLPGFFENQSRVALIIAGFVVLIWVDRIPSVRPLNGVLGVLAGGSLFIYLVHWQVYPHLYGFSPLLATLASLAAGVAYALAFRAASTLLRRRSRRSSGGNPANRAGFLLDRAGESLHN